MHQRDVQQVNTRYDRTEVMIGGRGSPLQVDQFHSGFAQSSTSSQVPLEAFQLDSFDSSDGRSSYILSVWGTLVILTFCWQKQQQSLDFILIILASLSIKLFTTTLCWLVCSILNKSPCSLLWLIVALTNGVRRPYGLFSHSVSVWDLSTWSIRLHLNRLFM